MLSRPNWKNTVFAFHDGDEIGPRMLARIAKTTGLRPEDLLIPLFGPKVSYVSLDASEGWTCVAQPHKPCLARAART